ncbi:MAG: 23S rRNA (uracil(1939)-C(5))-methyltransferase RlmD [Firmicutes bacterium]|nr:23S rRNA (uracil(1939)-C(5))-methyltransferase RlmD [Bacillota bacterium]
MKQKQAGLAVRQETKQNKKEDIEQNRKKNTRCPVASRCGGCRWIDRDYQEQLKAKETRFRKLMEPYCRPEAIIGMEQPEHYRCKVHAVFGEDRKHNIISGIYEEKSHRIVPMDSCLIEDKQADAIIVSIRGLLRSFKLQPYNEDAGYGLLRHVMIRTGRATGQIMVVLVLSSPVMPSKNNFVKALLKLHPEITTIVINVNDRDTSMVLGDREQVIYGKGYIEDILCGRRFRISPGSFYQVNPVQAEKLYRKAIDYAGLTGKETVIDAYCGTGTIGIAAAEKAGRVIGIELNPDAVRDARSNAKRNQVRNIEFYRNDAGKFLADMAAQSADLRLQPDVILMDPPRSGSSQEFLDAAAKAAPDRVVYVSCDPDTLVRDIKYLKKKGYAVQKCAAVDMFPFTEEIEAVALLTREAETAGRSGGYKNGQKKKYSGK